MSIFRTSRPGFSSRPRDGWWRWSWRRDGDAEHRTHAFDHLGESYV